jgi:hypothetical protein
MQEWSQPDSVHFQDNILKLEPYALLHFKPNHVQYCANLILEASRHITYTTMQTRLQTYLYHMGYSEGMCWIT